MVNIEETLLKSVMNLLGERPNSEQTLGLAKYVFYNELELFSKLELELRKLDR